MKRWLSLFALALLLSSASADGGEGQTLGAYLVDKSRVRQGICAIPHAEPCDLPVSVATHSELTVHAMHPDRDTVSRLQKNAKQTGLSGSRITVEKGHPDTLPYADNLVDLLLLHDVSRDDLREAPLTEILRVLRPRGKAILGGSTESDGHDLTADMLRDNLKEADVQHFSVWSDSRGTWAEITKPVPAGIDNWRHWNHGPDNNPYSEDRVIRAPYRTQWMGKPYRAAMPRITTIAGGRLFVATGHISQHKRTWRTMNTLTARNGYNGRILWQRELPEGYLVHRSAFVATKDALYMIDGEKCIHLDAETGRQTGKIAVPEVEGKLKWIALNDGILYLLGGVEKTPAKATKTDDRRAHGWNWQGLSPGYYEEPIPWGFGRTLAAYDTENEEVVWMHQEPEAVDSRAVGICDGKLYFYSPESRIGCLDARTGEMKWTTSESSVLSAIEEPGGGLLSTPGFKTCCMLLCTPSALYFEAQTRKYVVAVSAEDGAFLWKRERTRSNSNLLYADGKLIGQMGNYGTTTVHDPITGEILENLGYRKRCCVRMTGSPDAFYSRGGPGPITQRWGAGEGTVRWDREEEKAYMDGTLRPGCMDGELPANGLLYSGAWECDCNLSLKGTIAFSPADEFATSPEPAAERLERAPKVPHEIEDLATDAYDWSTYRGNNNRTGGSKAKVRGKAKRLWWHHTGEDGEPTSITTAGHLVFFGSKDGRVRCIDGRSGELRWEFATGGPVLMPPTIWKGRMLVGSGDGYVYSLEAATGQMLWRFRAAPKDRRIMVYGALSSTWPVNSCVLVDDGTAYAAAGIADHDGTFVYALDARTGEIKWQNTRSGDVDPEDRNGVAVQGNLTIGRGKLWLAGGGLVGPASYALDNGECFVDKVYYDEGRPAAPRGREIALFQGDYVINGGRLLYSEQGPAASHTSFEFFKLNSDGQATRPSTSLTELSAVAPAWSGDTFVFTENLYSGLTCWKAGMVEDLLRHRKKEATTLTETEAGRKKRRKAAAENPAESIRKWGPKECCCLALVVARNAVVAAGRMTGKDEGWEVCAFHEDSGRIMWSNNLPAQPVLGGVSIDRAGRVFVSLANGSVICVGPASDDS